ncbi:MAG: hypothetical protein PW843_15475 [Azospirillaceae bacterium]|nr:hypothetical protein [Azospirillaceae bacterium]
MAGVVGFGVGLVLTVLGIIQLRRVWASAEASRWRTLPGWGLLLAGFAGWLALADADKAIAIGILAFSVVGFVVVAVGMDRRRRPHRAPKTPQAAPSAPIGRRWVTTLRGTARTLLAGPLSAAIGLALAALVAVHAGGVEANRLVAAGFVGPIAWGAATTWALVDGRLARVGLLLPPVAIITVGAAWLGRV